MRRRAFSREAPAPMASSATLAVRASNSRASTAESMMAGRPTPWARLRWTRAALSTPTRYLPEFRKVLSGSPELKRTGDVFYAVGGAWRSIATIHMELQRAPLHMLQNYEMAAPKLMTLLDELMAGKKHGDLVQEVATPPRRNHSLCSSGSGRSARYGQVQECDGVLLRRARGHHFRQYGRSRAHGRPA